VKKRRAISIPQIKTLADADAHQRRHGFKPLLPQPTLPQLQAAADEASAKIKGKLRNVRQRKPNKTEREFGVLLEARKRTGELVEVRFEGVRLLWGGGMTYTADWSARRPDGKIEIHETKGAHIFDRDTVRFKGCRAEWQHWFVFYFHQRQKDGTWHQLL
jgi:hypothetical protein